MSRWAERRALLEKMRDSLFRRPATRAALAEALDRIDAGDALHDALLKDLDEQRTVNRELRAKLGKL